MNNWNAYTGPRDPINCPFNQENPALYEVAKKVTFDAGFPTWTDPRNGKVYNNPQLKNKRRKNAKSQNQKRR
jgi:hypothetical protein